MQILKPIIHETVWGGVRLIPYAGLKTECENIGHLYSVIDTPQRRSIFLNGPYKGKSIHDWFIENRDRYGLGHFKELPFITALVDATENLSIQVHPDDFVARRLESKEFGKNESFFLIKAPTSGRMFNGTRVKTCYEFQCLIDQGRVLEGVDSIEVEEGDYVYVEGGTLHAATEGSLSFEIEENCDLTYRIYDFDRLDKNGHSRPLQINQALASLDPCLKSKVTKLKANSCLRERLYELTLVKGREAYICEGNMFAFVMLLHGMIEVDGVKIQPGTSVLMEPDEVITLKGCTAMVSKPVPYKFENDKL